jgi:hypothetical protein
VPNKFAIFVEWLWTKRDVDMPFHPGVLTSTNLADQSLPRPTLTNLEAIDLFVYLKGLNLVFQKGQVDGVEIYSINKIEDYKWKAAIKELKIPEWKRMTWYLEFKKYLALIIAAFLGAAVGYYTKDLADYLKSPPSKQNTGNSSNSPSNHTK